MRININLVYGKDQRQPSHYQTTEVGLQSLGKGPALLPQSQRAHQILPGAPVAGGGCLGFAPETELEVDT